MDVQVGRDMRVNGLQELPKLDRAMPPARGGEHRPRLDVESREQRDRAMAPIVMRPAFCLAGPHWQQGRGPVQRLNLRLFVYAEHDRMRGRIDIQPDDVADFVDHALVLCVDEKSQIQALDRTQPQLPMQPGQAARQTHTYRRHGTTTLFAALDTQSGRVLGSLYPRHRSIEFRKFLDQIDAAVPTDLDVHLILDNYGTHKTPLIHRWLTKRPRFHLHFTPTYASWLNLVERWFAALTNKQLRRGAHRSVTALKRAIREFLDVHNADPKPLVWTKSADDILASIARFAHRTVTAHAR